MMNDEGYSREDGKLFVGEGWYGLIDEAFDYIEQHPSMWVTDIKEKWAGLRIYFYGGEDNSLDIIVAICDKSYTICEYCGRAGKVRNKLSWIKTMCYWCYVRTRIRHWWTYETTKMRRRRIRRRRAREEKRK